MNDWLYFIKKISRQVFVAVSVAMVIGYPAVAQTSETLPSWDYSTVPTTTEAEANFIELSDKKKSVDAVLSVVAKSATATRSFTNYTKNTAPEVLRELVKTRARSWSLSLPR